MKSMARRLTGTLLLIVFVFTCTVAAASPAEHKQQFQIQTKQKEIPTQAEKQNDQKAGSQLPAALQFIDDSAFEGTALASVRLPENVSYIGDRAFADIPELLSIHVPDSVKYIGRDAFAGSRNVTITAMEGSYARAWANNNGIPFAAMVTITASGGSVRIPGVFSGNTIQKRLSGNETTAVPRYSEQKGRTEGDIKAAKHEACFAHSIQGRSPPAAG